MYVVFFSFISLAQPAKLGNVAEILTELQKHLQWLRVFCTITLINRMCILHKLYKMHALVIKHEV